MTLKPVHLAFAVLTVALGAGGTTVSAQTASGPRGYTPADVAFTQGMILHHSQAVVMSDWAATHGARPGLVILAQRIALSQRDEIIMMQHWLQERHLSLPDPLHMLKGGHASAHDTSATGMPGMPGMPGMNMDGHPMTMPGMLTAAEMRQLDAARGTAFDRLYLTGMIKHHEGALDMVATLFATPGAGQQSELSAFAIDVDASQRAEIARMQAMLNTINESPTR